jgi:hypothetical protein
VKGFRRVSYLTNRFEQLFTKGFRRGRVLKMIDAGERREDVADLFKAQPGDPLPGAGLMFTG